MPVLANLKHERFANHIAGGLTQVEAYKSAGFKSKHPEAPACRLSKNPQVAARIKELTRRITNAAVRKATEEVAVTKELILRELWENAQRGAQVHGGSAVTNRALELLGKELGLFRDPVDKPPVKLDELPREVLESMLAEAEAKAAVESEAASQGVVAPTPPKAVN